MSSSDPGFYQLPSDCSADAQADNPEDTSCTQSLTVTGTLTITPDCLSDLTRPGGVGLEPPCIKQATKAEAQQAANLDAKQVVWDGVTYRLSCPRSWMRGGAGFCAQRIVQNNIDRDQERVDQQIADDPPDPGYAHVAKPHPPKAKGLPRLRRTLPATYRL
ncbi:MAG: hypothetical protein ACRDNS_07070, partial [Trebonia sp.]